MACFQYLGRVWSLGCASSLIVWTVVLLSQFDISNAGMQFSGSPWIDTLAWILG